MIPVTYPSSVSTSKESQMVVFALTSVAGLQRWTDYIPVKLQATGSDIANSFNTNGYLACDFLQSTTGKQAWVDYIPVYVDNAATTAWQVSDTGFIPFNTLAGGGLYYLGPSLDLNFVSTLSNPLSAATTEDYTLSTNFLSLFYQVEAQYSVQGPTGIEQKNFADIITFTRASSATFVGSNGLIQSATTNTPRFDYDPVTLAAKGLLIEEQRTNLLTYSQDFTQSAYWSPSGSLVVTGNSTNAPDGTTTAETLDNTASAAAYLYAAPSTTVGLSYVWSLYLKNSTAVTNLLQVRTSSTAAQVVVNWSGSTLSSLTVSAGSATFSDAGNGWYRIAIVYTAAESVARHRIYCGDGSTTTGVLYAWGAQLEAGSFATSYIPTVASQVTRSADDALVNTLSPWYNATTGSVYAEFTPFEAGTGGESVWQFLIDSTNRRTVYLGTSNRLGMIETSGGVTQANILTANNSIVLSAINKSAICYAANDFAISANGQAVVTDTLGDVAVGINALKLGSGAGVTNYLNGWLRRFTYYPRRLSNAELQTLTA